MMCTSIGLLSLATDKRSSEIVAAEIRARHCESLRWPQRSRAGRLRLNVLARLRARTAVPDWRWATASASCSSVRWWQARGVIVERLVMGCVGLVIAGRCVARANEHGRGTPTT